MDLPPELEQKLIAAAMECVEVTNEAFHVVHDTPEGRVVIEVKLLELPADSKDVLRIFEASRPPWKPGR